MKLNFFIKKLRVLMVVSLFIFSVAQAADIRIAVEGAYPPFSQTEKDGSVTGFDIDIANALCKEMKANCTLVTQEWDGMIPGLIAKKYDAIVASMSITEERKKAVNFTDKYYADAAVFAGKKGKSVRISKNLNANKNSLKGLRIGVQQGTVSDNFVTDNFGKAAKVRRYGKQTEANLDLVAGRLDLIMADSVTVKNFLESDDGKDFEIKGPAFDNQKWFGDGIGIAIRKSDGKLLRDFNRAIKRIRSNGVYKKINDSYFDFDIYGN